jgi:putative copper export protein
MEFLLWAARSLHVFAVVAWLGGLTYQSAVTLTVAKAEGTEFSQQTIHMLRRFVPFVWMLMWTVLVTGVALMLFSTRYVFFEFHDRWSLLLGLKQIAFLLMAFFSFGYARMFARVTELITSTKEQHSRDDAFPFFTRMNQFGRVIIVLGMIELLLASGLR